MDEDARKQRMVDLLVAGISYDDRTKSNLLHVIEPQVHPNQMPFTERKIPYNDLSNLVGEKVCIIFGETLLLNWNRGVIEYENGSYFVRRKSEHWDLNYKLKRQRDCKDFPWFGDGIWLEGIYIGQID